MGKVKIYSKEEDDYIKSNYLTKTYTQIAEDLGRTLASIDKRVRTLGLKKDKTTRESNGIFSYRFKDKPKEDLTGKRFGRLTVLRYKRGKKGFLWECKCDCGKQITTRSARLKNGQTKSCGCYARYISSQGNKTHGLSKTRIYRIWTGIKKRCLNPNSKEYVYYGGRGISICSDWADSFEAFYGWAKENGYNDNLTIERVDVNGDYCPENCCFIPFKDQCNNTTRSHIIVIDGVSMNLTQWCNFYNISERVVRHRLERGCDIMMALSTPKLIGREIYEKRGLLCGKQKRTG